MKSGEMTVTLPAELATLVRAELEQGTYDSGADIVQEALRQRYKAQKLQELNQALDIGIADMDAGRSSPLDQAFKNIRRAIAAK
ncbi:ribbon-helix-helix domain-containing protein [Bosea sp. LjRoot237]|uniref:ribbon-helix-helix domain-containing protein n=1 Tax=Bosea sp. LjRoot237 TaxID=3342292 RepID=UPI003ECCDEB9